jgi:hypothetical protein
VSVASPCSPEALRARHDASSRASPSDHAEEQQLAERHRTWGKGVLSVSAGTSWIYEIASRIAASGSLGARFGWSAASDAVLEAET